jgi:hypothetical protein
MTMFMWGFGLGILSGYVALIVIVREISKQELER